MRRISMIILVLLLLAVTPTFAQSDLNISGFLQSLYGGRLDKNNPTNTEQTASETRLQLRLEHFGDRGEFFGRLDFYYDGADSSQYDWELREGYMKFRMGNNFDFKIGRQVLTWGTGDLIFINDVFAKDYYSLFIGRDDQYLKAPQNALRMEYYNPLGSFSFVWTPRFEPNRLPQGERLSYFNPMANSGRGAIVGTGIDPSYYFDPPVPEPKFKNSEIATRYQRSVGNFKTALYFYHGFYKNPFGFDPINMTAVYPKLNLYGASLRGAVFSGVLWLEGGYYDSRQDKNGDNPFMPNSSVSGLMGFERQVATDLTVNAQWQLSYMLDYDNYKAQQQQMNPQGYIRDEIYHLLTSRVTQKLNSETIILSGFVFYSPSDADVYALVSAEYKYTDEITLKVGSNIFDGKHQSTDFGQFAKNDNVYFKMTYGFQ